MGGVSLEPTPLADGLLYLVERGGVAHDWRAMAADLGGKNPHDIGTKCIDRLVAAGYAREVRAPVEGRTHPAREVHLTAKGWDAFLRHYRISAGRFVIESRIMRVTRSRVMAAAKVPTA